MKLIINPNTYPMEEWGEREILFLKHELNPLDVEFLEKDNSNFYEADFYFGTSFDVNWVTFIENKMKLVIFPSQAKVNQELKQVLFNKKIPIIDCMPTTGIVNDKYTFYAIRYLIVVIRQYIEFERGINFKYAKKEYWYAAVCKLFNNKRINNLIDYTTKDYVQHKDFFEYCDMSKAKLLDAFKQSKRRWPYLALTVNSPIDPNAPAIWKKSVQICSHQILLYVPMGFVTSVLDDLCVRIYLMRVQKRKLNIVRHIIKYKQPIFIRCSHLVQQGYLKP